MARATGGPTINIQFKNEILKSAASPGNTNYVLQILLFLFQRRDYMVIAKKSGLIQLFEKCLDKNKCHPYYRLFKEWKNSIVNDSDQVACLGFFNNQYLYSCSTEGKLIIRDLINDDADESFMVYMIHGPVSSISLSIHMGRILLASAGKNCDLKLYDIDLLHQEIMTPEPPTSSLRATIDLDYSPAATVAIRPLRRTNVSTNLNLQRLSFHALTPCWSSKTLSPLYNAIPCETLSNWIVSICNVQRYIVCGTQFGQLLVYEYTDIYPVQKMRLELSQFAITNLTKLGTSPYFIYTDSMSKVGIIDTATFKVVNFYENLEIGPVVYLKFVIPKYLLRKRKYPKNSLHFDPIYVISTTIDKRTVLYKLHDDGTSELLLNVKLVDSLVPCVCVMGDEYDSFDKVFGSANNNEHDVQVKRKRTSFSQFKEVRLDESSIPEPAHKPVEHEVAKKLDCNEK